MSMRRNRCLGSPRWHRGYDCQSGRVVRRWDGRRSRTAGVGDPSRRLNVVFRALEYERALSERSDGAKGIAHLAA